METVGNQMKNDKSIEEALNDADPKDLQRKMEKELNQELRKIQETENFNKQFRIKIFV